MLYVELPLRCQKEGVLDGKERSREANTLWLHYIHLPLLYFEGKWNRFHTSLIKLRTQN